MPLASSSRVFARDNATYVAEESEYGYVPWESAAIVFIVLFGISTFVHIVQSLRYRLWWLLPTIVLSGVLEIVGWSARLYAHWYFTEENPFIIQIVTTIVAPIPLTAANFIIIEKIIRLLGPRYSRLSPKAYLRFFCSLDVIAFIIQAAGGAIAAGADTTSVSKLGSNIMLGGICLQLAFMIVFTLLVSEVFYRYFKDSPVRTPSADEKLGADAYALSEHPRTLLMIYAVAFSTFVLLIRAVYRTCELADGWHGVIILTQAYFVAFDACMVVLAIYALNFFHPGFLVFGHELL
ncbi:RTA1-domain-containing protein [Coniophora puteana RWD-64-598 SS2]|uniref:RTA1-domain-containing protein n=1 Tax=Coniophora puteana (strain RWD-64-598) TaxID=741705 RepID=A0A5M3MHL9_CONPW|nr:RTA1-domain-containing protein [Coniophora puteana RWD-64-598 SS2]EIW78506.1 RTA1-domain-containing protein [Coniophora puteana RWD-64-598 SS2]